MEKNYFYEKFIENIEQHKLTRDGIKKIIENIFFEKNIMSEILDYINEGIIFFDNNDKCIYQNKKAHIFFPKLKNEKGIDALPANIYDYYESVKNKLLNCIIPVKIMGTDYLLDFNFFRIKKTDFDGILIIFYDINAKSIEEREKSISQAMKDMMQMTYSVAHEIRNPLTALDLNLKLLEKQREMMPKTDNCKNCDVIFETRVSVIREEIIRLNKLLDKFLNTAKPINPKGSFQDLTKLINSICKTMKPAFKENKKNLKVEMDSPLSKLFIDEDLFKQIMINLIRNSLDSIENFDDGTVTIKIKEKKDSISIMIIDNGEGISNESKEKIFTPFYTTKANGTGLGLTIVYKLVTAMGGKINWKNNKKRGVKFLLEFNKNILPSHNLLTGPEEN